MQTFEEMTEFPRLHSCLCSKAAHNSNILLFLCKMCSREVIGLVLFFLLPFPEQLQAAHTEEMECATRLRLSFSSRISTWHGHGIRRD